MRASLLQAVCGQMTSKTATIDYKPVTSLAANNNWHITNSHVATFKYHMHYPVSMACMGAAVISVMLYPDTV